MGVRVMNGYILLHRKLLESDIWHKPPLYTKVWAYLLLNAQYQPYNNLERGQVRTSIPELQEACSYYVGYRKVTPTKDEVRGVLDYLRNPQRSHDMKEPTITTAKTTRGIIVTICNYDIYQRSKSDEPHDETVYEPHGEIYDEPINDKELRYKENKKKNIYTSKDCQEIIDLYNDICKSLPKCIKLSETRRKHISSRLKKYSEDEFAELFSKAEESDFLTGKKSEWKAGFDWLINENNMIKVLEGNYDNKTSAGNPFEF